MANPMIEDDDAPEEVTLNEGREEAEQSRRKEKENKKRLGAELKEKRRSRSERRNKEGVSDADVDTDPKLNGNEVAILPENSRSRKRRSRHSDATNSGEGLEGQQDIGSVMLDDSVVQLIRDREKQVAKGVGQAKHKYIEEEPKVEKPRKSDDGGPTISRTQIVSLKARPNSAAINSALEFRRSQLFGTHLKRSTTMLPTTSKAFIASV